MYQRVTVFDDKSVTISKMVLSDANTILIPIMNSIAKLAYGESDVFSHFKVQDVIKIQELVCKYTVFTETGKNLNLFDISNNISDYMGLSTEFLEFNFGFFSQPRKILQRINGQVSETEEQKQDQN
jgi:hypothetical protein